VICVGNVTVGGAGKTPTVLALIDIVDAHAGGPLAHVLTRGYGGALTGPVRVDPDRHTASEVGDEPLLLARAAPTWVARDRFAGALTAVAAGAGLVILDDGLQNPSLAKDLSLIVVDGAHGFGNGRVMPAGPLRERVATALTHVHGVIVIGDDRAGAGAEIRKTRPGVPVLSARIVPASAAATALKGNRVLAFAGIARPEKFFATLDAIGADIVDRHAFADHHHFSEAEIALLESEAKRRGARLVTTEKDHMRLERDVRERVAALPIALSFVDPAALDRLLAPILKQALGPAVAAEATHRHG
jgi:tetraacyldisaccharide 4'-kinase